MISCKCFESKCSFLNNWARTLAYNCWRIVGEKKQSPKKLNFKSTQIRFMLNKQYEPDIHFKWYNLIIFQSFTSMKFFFFTRNTTRCYSHPHTFFVMTLFIIMLHNHFILSPVWLYFIFFHHPLSCFPNFHECKTHTCVQSNHCVGVLQMKINRKKMFEWFESTGL